MTEYIFNFDSNPIYGMAYAVETKTEVCLNINNMIRGTKDHDVTFDALFSSCISHELIHIILERDISNKSSYAFDNLCYQKNKNIKEWFGGMA